MSSHSTGQKRRGEPLEQESRSTRSTALSALSGAESPQTAASPSRSYQEIKPFDVVADLAAIGPDDLTGNAMKGLSQARYDRDLFRIFSESLIRDKELASMHQTWYQCRAPSSDELWASRYPNKHGTESVTFKPTDTRTIMRTVLTIEGLRQQIVKVEQPAVAKKLAVLHFDYIMLMCLNCAQKGGLEEPEHRFPNYKEQFSSLAESLQSERSQEAPLRGNATLLADASIPQETRDMIFALKVDPSNVASQDKIAGYAVAKEDIETAVFVPTGLPHLAEYGWKGILLHGISGTGKTQLALSIASANSKCTVFHVLSSSIVDKYLGATERNVRALFAIAQQNTPSVVFIDEVDALFSVRETKYAEASTQRLKSELLSVLTMYSKVRVIGATNIPWALDTAFLRRFDSHIHVALPTLLERVEIMKLKLSDCLHELNDNEIAELAGVCDGFTGDAIRQAVALEVKAMIKKIRSAQFFRKTSLNGREVYCPCSNNHVDAEKLDLSTIISRVYPEPITAGGLRLAIGSLQRTVAIAKVDEEKHVRWSREMFQEV